MLDFLVKFIPSMFGTVKTIRRCSMEQKRELVTSVDETDKAVQVVERRLTEIT